MPLNNFLLTVHVVGAVLIFGPSIAYPFIGAKVRQPGAPVAWAVGVMEFISKKWIMPLALTVMPASGAWLIVNSQGLWNPFESRNRWLLAGIILYTIMMAFAVFVQIPRAQKAHQLAEAGQFGPEFGGLIKKVAMGGQFMTLLLITIIVLMVVKPGSGYIHP